VLESQRRKQQMAHMADYSMIRLRCSAVYPTLEIGAIVEGFDVSDEVREHPAFETMRLDTNLCVSYVNDIFSYAKEKSAGESSNLALVYERAHGLGFRDAMKYSMHTNDRVVEEYFEAKAHLSQDIEFDEDLLGYIKVMEDWMRGNFDWYNELRTARYTECLTTAVPA
jgi:hypothetical protein